MATAYEKQSKTVDDIQKNINLLNNRILLKNGKDGIVATRNPDGTYLFSIDQKWMSAHASDEIRQTEKQIKKFEREQKTLQSQMTIASRKANTTKRRLERQDEVTRHFSAVHPWIEWKNKQWKRWEDFREKYINKSNKKTPSVRLNIPRSPLKIIENKALNASSKLMQRFEKTFIGRGILKVRLTFIIRRLKI